MNKKEWVIFIWIWKYSRRKNKWIFCYWVSFISNKLDQKSLFYHMNHKENCVVVENSKGYVRNRKKCWPILLSRSQNFYDLWVVYDCLFFLKEKFSIVEHIQNESLWVLYIYLNHRLNYMFWGQRKHFFPNHFF